MTDTFSCSTSVTEGSEPIGDAAPPPVSPADRDAGQSQVQNTGELSIRNAAEWHQFLGESLGRGPELVLDLTQVETCDTAGLQLICSLRKTAALRGVRIRIAAMSPAIEATATAVGLAIQEFTVGGRAGEDTLNALTEGKSCGI